MKISILIPVFNTAKYLSACLDSILNQTESNWEVIAINDFSIMWKKELFLHYAWRLRRARART
jgi:hypothetical protein